MPRARWMGGGLLRVLCAFALLSLAFAHKPPQVMAAAFHTASLQLPDGSFADICVDGAAMKHPSGNRFCEVCSLCSSSLLPMPATDAWLLTGFASLANSAPFWQHRPSVPSIERPRSRAPPLLS